MCMLLIFILLDLLVISPFFVLLGTGSAVCFSNQIVVNEFFRLPSAKLDYLPHFVC